MTGNCRRHPVFFPHHLLVVTALLALAQPAGAVSATAPATDALTCAAVYGVISARPSSPRSQAATMARTRLLELRGLTVETPEVVAADALAGSQELATVGLMDERAGGCDRAQGFKVAEESPLAFRKTVAGQNAQASQDAQTGQNAQTGPYPPPPVTKPVRLTPPSQEKAPATTGSWGVLYARCDGEKRSFDPGLSRNALIEAARAQGCNDADIDNLLQARDLLSFN
ncbi:hypothetical protein ABI_42470 [Asticcacaulis biprosthecium C19]|uniref:Lipoprotein n=1 Tax=Asticcacaulis biprosthecium C19 TaxID=715226 RepID=F4QSV4_9CAUL|nr:hypothetical protein [Asticcacaulis biprosthecium]EGF89824.1 hypothetical protein ABI_42470 [Asticcacaulis biprosthecium C19]